MESVILKLMKEVFSYRQCWSPRSSNQEQTMSQNIADERFRYYVERMKHLGASVSPIKISLRLFEPEDPEDKVFSKWMYDQRVIVEASPELIERLKQECKTW